MSVSKENFVENRSADDTVNVVIKNSVLNLTNEILINIFKFIFWPKSFALACKRFSAITRDDQARAEWIIYKYGHAYALFHAIRLRPTFINLSVAKAMIANHANLSRYFIQRLLINFGKYDQQLIELKIAHNIVGQMDMNRINQKVKVPWSSNLQIPVFTYLMTEAQQPLETDNLCAKRNDMELFHFLSAGPRVINHTRDSLRKNLNFIRNLILNMKFLPFLPRLQRKFNSYNVQINSEEYPSKDGYENNRQLNVIARTVLKYEDLVHLWKQIGYYGTCKDTNDLVTQVALLILFLPMPSSEWKKSNVKDINKRLIELINLGFPDVFHLYEHRLDDIGNTLAESFLHVKQESLNTFLYHCILKMLKPERTYKMDVWNFIFSLNPGHAETESNKAFNNYLSNVASIIIFSDIHIKPLAPAPKFYVCVTRKFGADAQIITLCFNDLLESRVSLDIQLQTSNAEIPIGMNQCMFKAICDTFTIYCNAKKFLLPSHLETVSRSASHEILRPLFENYLPTLLGKEVTVPLPMETIEESNIIQIVEESNDMLIIEGDSNSDQEVNQNEVQSDFQFSSNKRRLKAKKIKEIKELWKQKLEDMHYNSIFSGSGLTNSFRNCLRIVVEEKLPYAEEKSSMVQELENVILEQNLVLHNYVDFAVIDKIDEGSVGIVYKSMWKNKLIVAVKCLKIDTKPEEKEFQQFVRELQILPKVCHHRNIIKLYGVTKNPSEKYYKIIFQFAEDGNLRDYLVKQFSNLKWTDKYRIAKEIALGLEFLHDNNIAHLDLHPRNILVHKGTMMIADFGISKQINDATLNSNSVIFGTPAYIEPQCLKDSGYVRNKKSDIYSLGFVYWEISSCKKPFQSVRSAGEIQMIIFEGKRETPANGTPQQYVELYTICWDDSPEERPDIKKVLEILNKLFVNDSRYLLL